MDQMTDDRDMQCATKLFSLLPGSRLTPWHWLALASAAVAVGAALALVTE